MKTKPIIPVLTRRALMSTLKRTYPNKTIKKVQETAFYNTGSNWIIFIGGEEDGDMLISEFDDCYGYDFRLNIEFSEWLESVGWYAELYDYGVYFLIPLSDIGEMEYQQSDSKEIKSQIEKEIKNGKVIRFTGNSVPF